MPVLGLDLPGGLQGDGRGCHQAELAGEFLLDVEGRIAQRRQGLGGAAELGNQTRGLN